jgi:hypothetical protein
MSFDPRTFLEGGGNIESLAGSFGVPPCMLQLGAAALALIPTPILFAIRHYMQEATKSIDRFLKGIIAEIRDALGISMHPDKDGWYGVFSEFSRKGLNIIAGVAAAINEFLELVNQVTAAIQDLVDLYNEVKDCIEQFKELQDYSGNSAGERREELRRQDPDKFQEGIEAEFGVMLDMYKKGYDQQQEFQRQIDVIDGILRARALDPSLEPGAPEQPVESVFRLDAGPPRATSGKFLLSIDGLYYDSQASGIEPALLELANRDADNRVTQPGQFPNADLWKLEFDPSIGGRGIPTTSKDLKYYFNTILDPTIIDDSASISNFYNQDDILVSLEGQKDRRVFDVSSEIQTLIDDGASQAVIDNMRQVMLSETAQFQDKVNKRKKQIELAIKLPAITGKGEIYTPGNVPVNDFSYLAGSNFIVDLKNQRDIVLDQADVTGVVLPLEVKYTEKIY